MVLKPSQGMSYEILKHTADVRLKVKGETLERLFSDALKGMMEILKTDIPTSQPGAKRQVSISAPDRTALLVDFLNEVLSLAQTHKEIYPEVVLKKLLETEVEAELKGVPVESFDEDIKAVTYHEAEVKQNEKGEWETILVFDI